MSLYIQDLEEFEEVEIEFEPDTTVLKKGAFVPTMRDYSDEESESMADSDEREPITSARDVEQCECDIPCVRFEVCSSVQQFARMMTEADKAWFQHKCKEETKITVEDYSRRRFFNKFASYHYDKWGTALEHYIKDKEPERSVCFLLRTGCDNQVKSVISRASLTCTKYSRVPECGAPISGGVVHSDVYGLLEKISDDRAYVDSMAQYEIESGRINSNDKMSVEVPFFEDVPTFVQAYFAERLVGTPFFIREKKVCTRQKSGQVLELNVELPEPTRASYDLVAQGAPVLPFVIPVEKQPIQTLVVGQTPFESVVIAVLDKARITLASHSIEGPWPYINHRVVRNCQCHQDAYLACYKHGVTVYLSSYSCCIGPKWDKVSAVWFRPQWPHATHTTMYSYRRKDGLKINPGIFAVSPQSLAHLERVYQQSFKGAVYGWPQRTINCGRGWTYLFRKEVPRLSLRHFSHQYYAFKEGQTIIQWAIIPNDLIVLLHLLLPEEALKREIEIYYWLVRKQLIQTGGDIFRRSRRISVPLLELNSFY